MEFTESLKQNHEFRRVYSRGTSSAQPCIVLYARPHGKKMNRLGLTVSNKVGNAVIRNRIRRRLREAYRLNEFRFRRGFDFVVVARKRSVSADYARLEAELIGAAKTLGVLNKEVSP